MENNVISVEELRQLTRKNTIGGEPKEPLARESVFEEHKKALASSDYSSYNCYKDIDKRYDKDENMDTDKYFEMLRQDQKDTELRLRDEQKQVEARLNVTVERIEKRLDKMEDKIDANLKETREAKRWGWGIAITVIFSVASVIISLIK